MYDGQSDYEKENDDMFQADSSARCTRDFYKIGGKLLGKGGDSCVRQAHSKANDEMVAVKII